MQRSAAVETSRDGITLRAEDAGSHYTLRETASGSEIGTIVNGSEASGLVHKTADGDGFDVRLVDGGPVVTTFTWEDLNELTASAYEQAEPPKGIVLHSVDGISWSREFIDDIAGVRHDLWGVGDRFRGCRCCQPEQHHRRRGPAPTAPADRHPGELTGLCCPHLSC